METHAERWPDELAPLEEPIRSSVPKDIRGMDQALSERLGRG